MNAPLANFVEKVSSKHFNCQAAAYSLAAAVAGVSMLALAQPAQGEVVVTKKTIVIPPFGNGTPVAIDINHDGVTDFTFYNSSSFGSADIWMKGGGVVGSQRGDAAALMRGANIGPADHFVSDFPYSVRIERGYGVESGGSDRLEGLWGGNPKNRYLGVRFTINGQTHYGWVRLTVITEPVPSWSAKITAYAYETVANKPILAGTAEKPGAELKVSGDMETQRGPSLGMLSSGADAVAMWRRDEPLTTK